MEEHNLRYCKFYKGEDSNPFEGKDPNRAMLWFYERCWIKTYKTADFAEYLTEYSLVGLSQFEAQDTIPITLKSLIFNRYAKTYFTMLDAVEPFKKFYKKYYTGIAEV